MADGKVTISTLLDNGGLEKGIKGVTGTLGGLAKTVAGVTASITAAFGAAAVAITKQAVDAYANYEQLIGGVETLFKDAADKVTGYAENAFYTVGISANEYMETVTSFSASLISSLAGDTAKAAKVADIALTDMADNANKMGTPLESIKTAYQGFAKQNYTMLDNLKLGYGGTKTEMERLLRDAQKLTGVKYNINNLSDVYNAIHAIQVELGIAGTTAKEAEKTIAGSGNMTKAAWNNVLTAIAGGGDLDKAIDNLVYSLSRYFDNMLPVVERSLEGIGVLIERIAPKLVETVAASLIRALPSLINAVYQMIVGLANGIYLGINALLSGDMEEINKQLNEDLKSAANGADKLTENIEQVEKAAKKALAPFDEITRIADQDNDPTGDFTFGSGSTSGTRGSGNAPNINVDHQKLTNLREGLEEVAKWTGIAAAAFSGFKLGGFITDLVFANASAETLKDTLMLFGKKGLLLGGITLAVTGFATEIAAIIDTVVNGLDGVNYAEILGGGGALIAGAAMIGKTFASTLLGTGIGAIIAGLPMYFTGIYDAIVNELNWLNGSLIGIGATLTGAGIGAIIGACGGPIGAGVGALIGLAVGIITDFTIWLWQNFEKIEAWFMDLPGWAKLLAGAIAVVMTCCMAVLPLVITAVVTIVKKWDDIKAAAKAVAEAIIEFFRPAAEWFGELFGSIYQTVSDVFYNIGVIVRGCWEIIKYVWDVGASHIKTNIIEPVAAAFSSLWLKVSNWAQSAWGKIKEIFGPAVQWIRASLIDPIVKGFEYLKDSAEKIMKDLLNGLIRMLNLGLENSFGNINGLLSGMKNLKIGDIQPFADLKMINVPKIPYLAQGAVLPPNKPFMAVVGDQKHGTNIEAPLETIKEAVRMELGTTEEAILAAAEALLERQDRILAAIEAIEVGDTTIGQAANRYNRRMAITMGGL